MSPQIFIDSGRIKWKALLPLMSWTIWNKFCLKNESAFYCSLYTLECAAWVLLLFSPFSFDTKNTLLWTSSGVESKMHVWCCGTCCLLPSEWGSLSSFSNLLQAAGHNHNLGLLSMSSWVNSECRCPAGDLCTRCIHCSTISILHYLLVCTFLVYRLRNM